MKVKEKETKTTNDTNTPSDEPSSEVNTTQGKGEDYGEDEEEDEDYGYLCTIFADFLCGLASAPDKVRYDAVLIRRKAIFGFKKCYKDGQWTSCKLGIDAIGIDIRGFYLPMALEVLRMHLYHWSGHPVHRKLLVTVGCMKHGCGEGKLKQAVIERLSRDETIEFELLDTDDATISITLDKIDYTSIGWPPYPEGNIYPDHGVASEKMTTVEEVKIDPDYGHLCTSVCDFLADLDTTDLGLLWDRLIGIKALSGLRKCEKDEPCELDDDTVGIDIRGFFVPKALKMMMTHLFCWSRQPDVKKLLVRVGCKVHGCGEGILKKKVIDLLKRDKKIVFGYEDEGTTISILLDGESDYKDTNWYLVNVKEEALLEEKAWAEFLNA